MAQRALHELPVFVKSAKQLMTRMLGPPRLEAVSTRPVTESEVKAIPYATRPERKTKVRATKIFFFSLRLGSVG
jgi:hypothetical protein